MIFPIGRKLLIDSINDAAASPSGPVHADKMVTLVCNDDGEVTVRKFELTDVGDSNAQYEFLHRALLDECPVKRFNDWAHLERAGKSRYPNGTGYGHGFIIGVLRKYGDSDPHATMMQMLADGKLRDLGQFKPSVGGGPYTMYAAV